MTTTSPWTSSLRIPSGGSARNSAAVILPVRMGINHLAFHYSTPSIHAFHHAHSHSLERLHIPRPIPRIRLARRPPDRLIALQKSRNERLLRQRRQHDSANRPIRHFFLGIIRIDNLHHR